nr:MAG TPA: hypothetical protein [Caudoviricetes sp.]
MHLNLINYLTSQCNSLCNPHGYWPQNGYFGRSEMCFIGLDRNYLIEDFKK